MSSITIFTGLLNYQLLEQYDVETGLSTGVYKPNTIEDPDYVAPLVSDICPIKTTSWIGNPETAYCETDGEFLLYIQNNGDLLLDKQLGVSTNFILSSNGDLIIDKDDAENYFIINGNLIYNDN